MYKALGDKMAQDVTRAMNPKGKHCDLLLMSPNACDGCHKNPHSKISKKDQYDPDLVEEFSDLIDLGFNLVTELEIGVMDPMTLMPIEYEALKEARKLVEEFRDERLADKILRGLAELLGGTTNDAGS